MTEQSSGRRHGGSRAGFAFCNFCFVAPGPRTRSPDLNRGPVTRHLSHATRHLVHLAGECHLASGTQHPAPSTQPSALCPQPSALNAADALVVIHQLLEQFVAVRVDVAAFSGIADGAARFVVVLTVIEAALT